MDETRKIRDEILEAALDEVVFDGWSWDVVVRGADKAGHSAAIVRGVFPEGLVSVLDYFAAWADQQMLAALADINIHDLRVRDRIHRAVMTRLEILRPYQEVERQALQYWIFPTRKLRAAKILWRSADCIWNWAGDDAQDYNRYTKRALLSGVISATIMVWINDRDQDMRTTDDFLARRIDDVMVFGKAVAGFKAGVKSRVS